MAAADRAMAQEEPFIEDVCEQLFLLEVLVDKIDIKTEGLLGSIEKKEEPVVEEEEEEEEEDEEEDEMTKRRKEEERRRKKKKKNTRPIKVKVKFFDFPTIEIDEWDFTEAKEEREMKMDMIKEDEEMNSEEEELRADEEDMTVEEYRELRARRRLELAEELADSMPPGDKFCSGKSCLFPMIPLDLVNAIKKSPLNIQVHRAGDAEQGPRMIGRTTIDLGSNFIEAIILASSPSVLPVSAFIDGPYPLKNVFDEMTANVHLYVRISCFGNSIFTQFKLKEGEKDYLFKMTGRKMEAAERMHERQKCGKRSDEYLPKLSPIFTKLEDFTVGAKAPLLHTIEPKLKLPVSWHKTGVRLPSFKVCAPEKLCKKPLPKTKYRKTITIEHQILRRLIPGFGRQAGDPEFFTNNPTLPRYCEMKNKEGDKAGDASDAISLSKETVDSLLSEFKVGADKEICDKETPGAKFPCQYGTSWKPLEFPLPRQEMYPEVESLFEPEEIPYKLPSLDEAKDIVQRRRTSEQEHMKVANGKKGVYLKCTCRKILQSLQQKQKQCDCATTIKSKFISMDLKPEEADTFKPSLPSVKDYKPVEDPLEIIECLKNKFPIPGDVDDSKESIMIFMFRVENGYFTGRDKLYRKKEIRKSYKITINSSSFNECFGKNWTNPTDNQQIHKSAKKKSKSSEKRKKDLKETKLMEDEEISTSTGVGCTNVECKCRCKSKQLAIGIPFQYMDEEVGEGEEEEDSLSPPDAKSKGATSKRMLRIEREREERGQKAREKLKMMRAAIDHFKKQEEGKRLWKEMIEEKKKKEELEAEEGTEKEGEKPVEEPGKPAEEPTKPTEESGKLEETKQPEEETLSIRNGQPDTISVLTSTTFRHHMKKKKKQQKDDSLDEEQTPTIEDFQDLIKVRGKLFELLTESKEKDIGKNGKQGIKYIYTAGRYPGVQVGHYTCVPTGQLVTAGIQDRCRGLYNEIEEGDKKKIETEKKKKGKGKEADDSEKSDKSDSSGRSAPVQNETEEFEKMSKNYVKLATNDMDISPTLHIHKTKGKYSIVMCPTDPLREGIKKDERVMFTFDTKNPDGLSDYESSSDDDDDASTVTEDSLLIEYTSPLGVYRMNVPPVKHSLASQTRESAVRDDIKKKRLDKKSSDSEDDDMDDDYEETKPEEPFERSTKAIASALSGAARMSSPPSKSAQTSPISPPSSPVVTVMPAQVFTGPQAAKLAAQQAKSPESVSPTMSAQKMAAKSSRDPSPVGKKRVLIVEPKSDTEPAVRFQPPPLSALPKAAILKPSKFHQYGYSKK